MTIKNFILLLVGGIGVCSAGCRAAGTDYRTDGSAQRASLFPSLLSSRQEASYSTPVVEEPPPTILAKPTPKGEESKTVLPKAEPTTLPVTPVPVTPLPKIADPETVFPSPAKGLEPEKIYPDKKTVPSPKDQPKNKTPLRKFPSVPENPPQLPPISLKKSEIVPVPLVRDEDPEETTRRRAAAQKLEMEKALADLTRQVEASGPNVPAASPAAVTPMPPLDDQSPVKKISAVVPAPSTSSQYADLEGKIYLWRNQWYLRFAALGSDDPLGGTVRLMDNPWAHQLREGQTIRVGGRIATAASPNTPALYQVERLVVVE